MEALLWLAGALVAGVAAYLVGWPAWKGYRSREQRDLNAERYLAWRGRARRPSHVDTREGMTGEERRRLAVAGGLGAVAVFWLIGVLGGGGVVTPAAGGGTGHD
jgi:hypothetical protein